MAINGTQRVVESYVKRAKSANCRDVVGIDVSDKFDIAKFMLKSLPGGFSQNTSLPVLMAAIAETA